MALTHEEVRKIAALARLRFTPEQEGMFVDQLGKIVDYIDQLQAYEGEGSGVSPLPPREASDASSACLPRERFLANAPETAFDAFLVVPEVKGGGGDA